MFLQLDLLDAHMNPRPDGSLEILGQEGRVVVSGKYADKIRESHKKFFAAYPQVGSLKIVINIELPQPIGAMVNEG